MTTSLSSEKLKKALDLTAAVLKQDSLTLKEAQQLTGFLGFCALVIRLGWVFIRRL
jgi:hypothetical protein